MKCMPFWKGCNRNIDYVDQRQRCLVKVPDEIERYSKTLEELLLDSNMIRELPNSLFRLEQLRKLTLSDNQLPRLQADFANLSNLQELDVSKNDLCQVTESIKHLKNLQVLDLSCNPLQDLPISLTSLKNLTSLSINDIAICKLPQDIGNLSSLEILEARDNLLNSLPSSLGDLSCLRVLDVGSNSIDILPESISQLSSLQEMRLDYNELSELPDDIGELKCILELDLSENKIEVLPIKIGGLCDLTDLDLSQNLLEYLPDSIGELKSLIILKLDQNRLVQLTQSIGNCSCLQELILTENLLTELPASLGKLKNLSILNADKNRLSSLPSKVGGCSRLSVLSLRDNTLWRLPNDIGLLKELHVLDVSGNRLQNLPISLNSCNLKALWLSENQAQPLLKFQQETDEDTGAQVLTCFLLPQQAYTESMENLLKESYTGDDDNKYHWNEAPRSMVKFAEDVNDDDDDDDDHSIRKDPSANNFVRHNTPHPKDLRLRHNKMLEKNLDGHMIPHKATKNPRENDDLPDEGGRQLNTTEVFPHLDHGFNDNTSNSQYHQTDEEFSNQLQQQQLLLQQQQQLIEQQLSNNAFEVDCRQDVVVRVVKTPGIGLGISIAGGLGSVPYEGNDDGIFVSKVNPTGAAEKCGVIPGDKILSVNGESMVAIQHNRAVEVLKAGGSDMLLLLSRKVNSLNNTKNVINNNIINSSITDNININNNPLNASNNNEDIFNNIVNNNYITDNTPFNANTMGDNPLPYNTSHNGYLDNTANEKLATATQNLDELLNQNLSPIHPLISPQQPPTSFSPTSFSTSLTSPLNPYSSSTIISPDAYNPNFNPNFNQPLAYPNSSPSSKKVSFTPTYPPTTQPLYPIADITIEKVNGALGLSIVGGVGHTSQPFGTGQAGIYISKITKNGPASKTKLRVGDRLLMVDGTDVTNATHLAVVTLLVVPVHQVTIRVSQDPQPSGFKEICLTKEDGEQLGLTIVGGVGDEGDEVKGEGIFISRILPNSVASRCDHLRSGQRILEVNGHTFLGVSQREALEVFSADCNNTYNIIICDGLNKHQQAPLQQQQQQQDFQQQSQQQELPLQPQQPGQQQPQQLQTQLQQSQQHLQQLLIQQQQQQTWSQDSSCQQTPSQQKAAPVTLQQQHQHQQRSSRITSSSSSSSSSKPPTSILKPSLPPLLPPSKPPSPRHHPTHHRSTPANTLTGISLIKKTPITLSSITISPFDLPPHPSIDSTFHKNPNGNVVTGNSNVLNSSSFFSSSSSSSASSSSASVFSSPCYSSKTTSSYSSPSTTTSLSTPATTSILSLYTKTTSADSNFLLVSSSSPSSSSPMSLSSSSSSSSFSSSVRFARSTSAKTSNPNYHLPPLPPVLQNLLSTPKSPNGKNSTSMDNLLETNSASSSQSPVQKLDRKSSLDASMRPTQYLNRQTSSDEERKARAEQRKQARLQFLEGASTRVNEQLGSSRDVSPRPPIK